MKVAVIKYNAGNIRSVDYALRRLGVTPVITADKEELLGADRIIFPGVGEAKTTMQFLKKEGMDQLIPSFPPTGTGDMPRYAAHVQPFGRRRCGLSEYLPD